MDRYFVYPGVKKEEPFKPRVHYFDSFPRLRNFLRACDDDFVGQRDLKIYFICKSLLSEGFHKDEIDIEVPALKMFEKAQERIDNGVVDQLMSWPREKKSTTKTPTGQSKKSKASSANGKRRISGGLSSVNIVKGSRRRRVNS